ncbi:MAG: helix-turn-helix transcriptional regulator [Solirubrobacterales bacterium]|nr:helix-turn-helix transcriptional regulator [Solirubrobacterales bacterium]
MTAATLERIAESEVNWGCVARVMLHPTQTGILELMADGRETCPRDLAAELGVSMPDAGYHTRQLWMKGVLDRTRSGTSRGATVHYYRLGGAR